RGADGLVGSEGGGEVPDGRVAELLVAPADGEGGGQEPEGAVPRAEVAGADGDDDVAVFEESAPSRLVEVAAEGAGGVFVAGEPDRFGEEGDDGGPAGVPQHRGDVEFAQPVGGFGVAVGLGQPEGARRVIEGDVEQVGPGVD